MDQLTLLQVRITNLLANAVELHDKFGHGVDQINEELKNGNLESSLKEAGEGLNHLINIYNELRDVAISFEYAAGHDIFTIMNDFKLTKPTIMKALKKEGIQLRQNKAHTK